MDAFSYLSVLLSIIIGLAITQVLQGYRLLLLARGRVRADPTTLLWSLLLILFATQAWWASFGLREHFEWSFLAFASVLLQMILLYMATAVILPDIGPEGDVDLAAHFGQHRTAFFGFIIALLAASIVKDVILNGALPGTANLLFHASLAALALIGIAVRSSRVQFGLALVAATGFAAYVALLFARL
jgi:hypothetical protein